MYYFAAVYGTGRAAENEQVTSLNRSYFFAYTCISCWSVLYW